MYIQTLVDRLLQLKASHGNVNVAIEDADTGWNLLLDACPYYNEEQNVIVLSSGYGNEITERLE